MWIQSILLMSLLEGETEFQDRAETQFKAHWMGRPQTFTYFTNQVVSRDRRNPIPGFLDRVDVLAWLKNKQSSWQVRCTRALPVKQDLGKGSDCVFFFLFYSSNWNSFQLYIQVYCSCILMLSRDKPLQSHRDLTKPQGAWQYLRFPGVQTLCSHRESWEASTQISSGSPWESSFKCQV